jgi:hypothetical protein
MDREKLEPRIKSGWGWEWAEVENGIRPGRTDKGRARFKGPEAASAAPGRMCIRGKDLVLDGGMFVRLEDSDEDGRTYPAVVVITDSQRDSPAELNAHFDYFRFLGFGVMDRPDENMSPRLVYPRDHYWMPNALEQNASKYVDGGDEAFNGIVCRKLGREGWDEWLIDMGASVRPRRRTFRWSEGGLVREVIEYSDFRPTGKGIDLPWKIVYTSYASPRDDEKFHGKPSRRLTVTVKELFTDPLPDSYFRPDIPDGSLVDDLATGGGRPLSFIHKEGVDPFARAVASLEKARPPHRFPYLVLFLLATVLLVAGAALWRWRRQARAQA